MPGDFHVSYGSMVGENRHFAGLNWNLCETIKFKNYSKQLAVPFKIYDDFESVLKWAQSDDRGSNAFYNKKYQKHIPCNFA